LSAFYRDLLKHSGVYAVGQVLTRLASVILLPVYTSYLTPADYGCFAILDVTVNILGIMVGAGIGQAVNRFHFEVHEPASQQKLWWTGLSFLILIATLGLVPCWMLRNWLGTITLGQAYESGGFYYSLLLPTLWCQIVTQFQDVYFRVRKWSGLSTAIKLFYLILGITLNVSFLAIWHLGIVGILLGQLIASLATLAICSAVMCLNMGWYRIEISHIPALWRFGSPLIVTAVLGMLLHQADRYLLRVFVTMDEVGTYALANTVGQGINSLILVPFMSIWSVVIYEISGRPEAKTVFANVFKYYVAMVMLIMLGVSLAAKPLAAMALAPDYAPTAELLPVICLAYTFFSLHAHFCVPALLAKRTLNMVPVFTAATGASIGFNLLLIPTFGAHGAAWTSVLTFFLFSFGGLLLYRRIDRFPYPLGWSSAILCGMIGTYLFIRMLDYLNISAFGLLVIGACCWLAWAVALGLYFVRPQLRAWMKESRKPHTAERFDETEQIIVASHVECDG
jgi:O-antigen/teichoic acid export membrane protein